MASHEKSDKAQAHTDEVIEYDSDSEEGTTASTFRRRAASDDEEDDPGTNTGRRHQYYDEEEEDQGAPPGEEEEEEEEEDGEGEGEEEEEYEDGEDVGELAARKDEFESGEAWSKDLQEERGADAGKASASSGTSSIKGRVEEEKKELEPFVVPTAGAFYMHDDRFRYNGVPRPRRGAGGRRLWEAKDEKPWLHDRFEELKFNEDSYFGQGVRGRRGGRGRQGRGLSRGKSSVHARGRGNKEWVAEDAHQFSYRHGRGRGRGLRRAKMDDYEFKEPQSTGNRIPSSASQESSSAVGTSKFPVSRGNVKSQESASKKPTTSSILNSASPPFFPTGSVTHNLNGVVSAANKDDKISEKGAQQMGRTTNAPRNAMEKGLSSSSTASKPVSSSGNVTSAGLVSNMEMDASAHRNAARPSSGIQQQILKTGPGSMIQQHRPVRTDANLRLIEQPAVSAAPQQQSREAPPAQPLHVQQSNQSLQRISPVQVSHGQSQPAQSQSVPMSSNPVSDVKAAPALATSKIGSSTTGRSTQATTIQPGMGTFVYGSSSLTNGLHSVVQFASQPQPGLGVPVALPGYSSQPQFGFPNSEVTWIPILAGGSMGSNYSSPYIAMDGNSPAVYYTQASQPSSFSVPGDPAGSKTGTSGLFKPSGRPEPDELGQQRKRYSQMTFGEERR